MDKFKKKQQGKNPFRFILLIGDYAPEEAKSADWYLPSIDYYDLITTETKAFSDVLFGDLDSNGVPDIPVGRLVVRNSGQLQTQLRKIAAFQQRPFSPAHYQANLWVGGLGFTQQINDIVLDQSYRIPSWMNKTIISAHPKSPYAGHIPDQPSIFLNQVSRPFFLSLVASHGSYREIHQTVFKGQKIHLTVDDLSRLNSLNPSGLTFLLSCNTGQFNLPISSGLSFSETLANHIGGPIALVSATGTSHPLTNHYITESLLQVIPNQPETVGELLLSIQKQLTELGTDSFNRLMQSDESARKLASAIPERDRHTLYLPGLLKKNVLLYNLIGDPSIPLYLPGDLQLAIKHRDKDRLLISGSTKTDCHKLYVDLLPAGKYSGEHRFETIADRRKVFNEVNSRPHFMLSKDISGTEFSVTVPIKKNLRRKDGVLRVIAVGWEKNYVATATF